MAKFFVGLTVLIGAFLLFALLFPSVSDGPDYRAREKNEVVQFAQGLIFYKQEYGVYPEGDQATILKFFRETTNSRLFSMRSTRSS